MQFLLFDLSATLLFLFGYVTVVGLQRRRALPVVAAASGMRRERPAAGRDERKPVAAPREPVAAPRELDPSPCCREWPRLSAPR